MKRIALLALAAASFCTSAHADPIKILFVGNMGRTARRRGRPR